MSYWQAGNSPEQNGCFKMKNTEAKEMSPPVSHYHLDDEPIGFVKDLNSPADISTLSEISNTPPMHAPKK
jgi:hypothetical protein